MTIIIVMEMPSKKYVLIYAPRVKDHLRTIERKYYSLIRNKIEEQLLFEPDVETRNKKPMKRPVEFGADWEIRFGPENRFRVFCEVNNEQKRVHILAIGVKKGNRLFFGREEVIL